MSGPPPVVRRSSVVATRAGRLLAGLAGLLALPRCVELPGCGDHERTDDGADQTARREVDAVTGDEADEQPADERTAEAGHERHGPIGRLTVATQDELREPADDETEQDDSQNEHVGTLSQSVHSPAGPPHRRTIERNENPMIRGLLAALVVFLLATFPATWLLMLFLGNIDVAIGYWGTLPMGVLVSVLLGSASAPTFVVRD